MNITGGKYNRLKIIAPDENVTRPTLSKVRMGVFNTLASIMEFEGKSFLDMYAGSGIMGLEAFSRGFLKITAIENNKKVLNVIKSNLKNFDTDGAVELIYGDSLKVCKKLNKKFDVIYIDPPYYSGIYEKSLEAVLNLTAGVVIVEHVTDVVFPPNFAVIKQKKYGDKFVTFLRVRR